MPEKKVAIGMWTPQDRTRLCDIISHRTRVNLGRATCRGRVLGELVEKEHRRLKLDKKYGPVDGN